jgi:hypothetical protein
MANYSLDQAQRDIANTRYLIQALANSGQFTNVSIANKVTFPDGSTWTVSGPSLVVPLPLAQGGTGVAAGSNAALVSAIGAQPAGSYAPTASPTFTGTITMPDGSTWNATQLNLAALLAAANVSAPSAPGSGIVMYSNGDQLKFVSADGNTYRNGTITVFETSNQVAGSSATSIPGCSVSVKAKAYKFRAEVICFTGTGTAGGQLNYGWTGPTTSTAWMTSLFSNGGYGRQTGALFGSGVAAVAASTTYSGYVSGYAVFTAAGTLTLAVNTTTTVSVTAQLAKMEVEPLY